MLEMALARNEPYLFSVYKRLEKVRVYDGSFTSSITDNRLYLGDKFFKVDWIGQYFYLVHELLHWVGKHPYRLKVLGDKYRKLFNICADAKINYFIMKEYPKARQYLKDWTTVFDKNDLERLSIEELMVKYYNLDYTNFDYDIEASDDYDTSMSSIFFSTGRVFRTIGNSLYNESSAVMNIYKAFDFVVEKLNGKIVFDTFGIPSRRRGLPAYRQYGVGDITFVVDVSGSISNDIINKFNSIMSRFEGKFIYFDDGVVTVSDKPLSGVMGGGRTKILPALEEVGNARNVVVLSDGLWDDLDNARKWFEMNRDKHIIFLSSLKCYSFVSCIRI